jgi:soluble lytic murein transglycosylase-like protein
MKVESNYDRWAKSPKGARGLMQLIPETGKRFGVRDFNDPQQNILGGVRYLRFLTDKFDSNLDLVLSAYNAGENLVDRVKRIPAIKETQDYVRKIRSIYKPVNSPAPASASAIVDAKPAVPVAPAPALVNTIYRTVDARGVVHFSNVAPPR